MASGPLKSALFKDNDRLQKCAQVDPAHVQPNDPPSEHVAKIQQALRQVDGANIPATETNYGPATVKAVVAFKTKYSIFTRGTHSIDPITGIHTIAKLDELLAKKQPPVPPPPPKPPGPKPPPKPPGPVPPPKPPEPPKPPNPAPTPVPQLRLSGQCQLINKQMDDPNAPDLHFADPLAARRSFVTAGVVAPFVAMSDETLQNIMRTVMGAAVMIAAKKSEGLVVRAAALLAVEKFFGGNQVPKIFEKGSSVSAAATDDDGFQIFASQFESAIDKAVRIAWKAGLVDDQIIAAQMQGLKFEVGQFGGALTAFIGGFQGFTVKMCNFQADTAARRFTYSLDVELYDHFGVDDTDINRNDVFGTATIGAAMASFFVLQHDRSALPLNRLAGNFRPFRIILRTDTKLHTGVVF